ncbi:MAG TPA: nucleotide exchange factor GrpE [Kineosporiaceae bacterium]
MERDDVTDGRGTETTTRPEPEATGPTPADQIRPEPAPESARGSGARYPAGGEEPGGPVVRDKRRLDPQTGQVRAAYSATEPSAAETGQQQVDLGATDGGATAPAAGHLAELEAARAVADERLLDLQRLQAEFVNYRRRVDRDRDVARDVAVASVLEALLPVLDDVHLARQHGDLVSGPFAAIAEKLEATLVRFGLVRYGEPGEAFDPKIHEALLHTQAELAEGTTEPTVVQILQPGYRAGERVLRAARVAVADPQ